MAERFKKWINENIWLMLGYIFIWFIPIVLLMILATETKDAGLSLQLWGASIFVILLAVYFIKLRNFIKEKKRRELTEQNRIPIPVRLLDLLVVIIGFVAIILVINSTQKMYDKLMTFIICSFISELIGQIFLIVDSYKRKPEYLNRVKERDCDK